MSVCFQVNANTLSSLGKSAASEPGGRRRRKTAFEAPKQLNLLQAPLRMSVNSSTGTPMKRSLSDTDDKEIIAKIREAQEKQWGNMTLYFGCRRSNLDYIYKDELMRAKVCGALTDVHVAFSREPDKPKVCIICSNVMYMGSTQEARPLEGKVERKVERNDVCVCWAKDVYRVYTRVEEVQVVVGCPCVGWFVRRYQGRI